MSQGPDFTQKTKDTLAKRAGQVCSNPDCWRTTSGPHTEDDRAINLGEAAHIKAAREGSARYDPNMTDEERSDISNGIWLCRECARRIDLDEKKYPVDLLHCWKKEHEELIASGKLIMVRNGPNLKIILNYYPQTGLGTSFRVRLVNSGPRPITLTDVLLCLKSGTQISYLELRARYIQLSAPLPLTLRETEFRDFLFPLYFMYELKNEEITTPLDVISVEAYDSLEGRYEYPLLSDESQEAFSRLQGQIQKHWEKESWL
jgi:hypothetical protein